MIQLLYTDIRQISEQRFDEELAQLPPAMRADIERYRFMKDRKCRLAGRVMIRERLRRQMVGVDLRQWQIDHNKKPLLPRAPYSSISHSGHLVLLAIAPLGIGVDIEREGTIDSQAIVHFFHPSEIEYYHAATDPQSAFFNIWVRKEAFLKAVGTGIVEGLDTVSVLDDVVRYHGQQWYLHKIDRWAAYQSALCSPQPVAGWWWKPFFW